MAQGLETCTQSWSTYVDRYVRTRSNTVYVIVQQQLFATTTKKGGCASYHRYTYLYVWYFFKVVRSEKRQGNYCYNSVIFHAVKKLCLLCCFQSEKTIWLITAIITNFPQKVCYFLELHIKAKQKAILAKNFTTISWGPHHPESRRRWRIEAGTQNFFRFNLVNDTVTFSFLLSRYITSAQLVSICGVSFKKILFWKEKSWSVLDVAPTYFKLKRNREAIRQ